MIYRRLLKPAGLVKPHFTPDYHEPHRFAQGFSGLVTALSALLVWSGQGAVGWMLSWLVILLANLNVFLGFCAAVSSMPELARQYNILTLPTTILIDSQGKARYLNPGLTNRFKLAQQLAELTIGFG